MAFCTSSYARWYGLFVIGLSCVGGALLFQNPDHFVSSAALTLSPIFSATLRLLSFLLPSVVVHTSTMRVWELFQVMVSHAASKHEDYNRYRILSPFRHLVILQSTSDDPRSLSPAILRKPPHTLLYRPFPLFLLHLSNTSSLTFCQTLWSRTAVSITTLTSACYASSAKPRLVTRALLILYPSL
jgi:hypothetical protein